MTRNIRFTETILRDAHQSQIATRMTTDQMLPILEDLDNAGFASLEAWGGATFDACLRYLNEDPWERLRTIRKHVKNTKLQMLLRGQNLLGYKHYDDAVVDLFIQKSIENGIDIVRIFDALNDVRNLETSCKAVKKYGGHAQLTICYTISDVHTNVYYTELVKKLEAMGADSICIKDMAGILTPYHAYSLVKDIKAVTGLPIHVHTHATSGVSEMTYLKALEAGADSIDTANSSFAGGTSQPSTESMVIALNEFGYKTGIDLKKCNTIATYLRTVKDEFYESGIFNPKVLQTDPNTLLYQVPGGMISNLLTQLNDAHQLDKFDEVLAEIPKVREELGYPPLVTPLSQMVGTQAVMNVLSGERYKLVPNEIKEYVEGKYGASPAPIQDQIFDYLHINKKDVITQRPADLIHTDLAEIRKEHESILKNDEDFLSYLLFPQIALPFLRKKYDPFYDVEEQLVTIIMD